MLLLYIEKLYWVWTQTWIFFYFIFFTENAADADSCICGVLGMFTAANEDMII